MTQPASSEASALRLITRHRVSLANVLPEKYQYRIEQTPGVEVCSKFTWFGGVYQDERNFFPQFAVEPEKIFRIFTEGRIDPAAVGRLHQGEDLLHRGHQNHGTLRLEDRGSHHPAGHHLGLQPGTDHSRGVPGGH
jgi:hypothetical protein